MALVAADRVAETSTTTGTGAYSLAGVLDSSYQIFVAGVGDGNTCYYCAFEDGVGWEIGLGTVTDASPDTLSRDTILASSNGGAAVDWGAGTRTIFVTVPAALATYLFEQADAVWEAGTGTDPSVVAPDAIAAAIVAQALLPDVENQAITGGATITPKNLGTQSSGTLTVDCGDCPWQRVINGGAFALDLSAVVSSTYLEIINNASAGAITTSAFDIVDGDSFDTTENNVFLCHVGYTYNGKKFLSVKALQ